MKDDEAVLREEILKLIRRIYQLRSCQAVFRPGKDMVRYAAAVYDNEEVESMINAILDGWFGVGKYAHRFETELAKFVGVRRAVITNSGSSANLLAVSALLSSQLSEDVRLKPGDEVITPALAFPTTFNPIIQCNLVPVLLDADATTYNIRADDLETAISDKTRAIVVSHTLGNPNEMDVLTESAEDHDLFLIEDACDALGSKYDGRHVGSFGSFGTFSFYPAHQITTGEGGALVTSDEELSEIAVSLRDWGRACVMSVCSPLHCPDRSCPKSVSYEKTTISDDFPEDYDKRYAYTNIGYNLKPTEIQAAMGLAQLKKLPGFIESRRRNFELLYEELQDYEDLFILPKWLPKSEPAWFAFPLTITERAPFRRKDVVEWLTRRNIEVKMLFAGNILKHPAYKGINCRIDQKLTNCDFIMRNSFFIGVYPGINEERMNYVVDALRKFINKHR